MINRVFFTPVSLSLESERRQFSFKIFCDRSKRKPRLTERFWENTAGKIKTDKTKTGKIDRNEMPVGNMTVANRHKQNWYWQITTGKLKLAYHDW